MNSRPCPDARGLTLLASGLVFAACIAAIATLTRGFEHWTFEDLRTARASRGELRAPPTPVTTSSGDTIVLFGDDQPRSVYLVDFIYTACPGVCRVLGSEYQLMQQQLDAMPSPGVKLLSLSFDVERDGQAQLAAYAALHRAQPDRWTVATPVGAAGNRQLLQALGVVAVADGMGAYVHNGDIHVIDGAGVLHGIHAFDQWPAALAAARRLSAPAP